MRASQYSALLPTAILLRSSHRRPFRAGTGDENGGGQGGGAVIGNRISEDARQSTVRNVPLHLLEDDVIGQGPVRDALAGGRATGGHADSGGRPRSFRSASSLKA